MSTIRENGRTLYEIDCAQCGIKIYRRKTQLKKHNYFVCSKKCNSIYKNQEVEKKCSYCDTEILVKRSVAKKSRSGNNFCDSSCAASFNNKITKKKGELPIWSYRKIAFANYALKCNRCDYDRYEGVLQVHHKDRDRRNCNLDNLEILCPTCHSEDHYLNGDGIFSNKVTVL